MAEGKLQVEGEVIHVIVEGGYNFSLLLNNLTTPENEGVSELTSIQTEQVDRLLKEGNDQEGIFPKARSFR